MNWLVSAILNWAYGKLVDLVRAGFSWLQEKWNILARRKVIAKEAEDSVIPLKDAKTEKEIDDAAKTSLDNL